MTKNITFLEICWKKCILGLDSIAVFAAKSFQTYGAKYSRMGQVKFLQSCLPQILLDSFLNTFSHKNFYRFHSVSFKIRHFYRFYSFCCWVAIMENILQTQTRIISAYIYPTLPFLQFLHYFRRYRFCISHSFIFYHWPTSYIKSLKSSH